jgi:hypothetical protein
MIDPFRFFPVGAEVEILMPPGSDPRWAPGIVLGLNRARTHVHVQRVGSKAGAYYAFHASQLGVLVRSKLWKAR